MTGENREFLLRLSGHLALSTRLPFSLLVKMFYFSVEHQPGPIKLTDTDMDFKLSGSYSNPSLVSTSA